MVPEWISHIESDGACSRPIFVNQAGSFRPGTLDGAMPRMSGRTWRILSGVRVRLSSLTEVAPAAYLNAIGFPHASQDGHAVYRFLVGDVVVYAPAIVLLHALLGRLHGFGQHLLARNGLSICTFALVEDNKLRVRLPRNFAISCRSQDTDTFQTHMGWLISHLSARVMWDSVAIHAMQGRLNLSLPLADVAINIHGKKIGDEVFAHRIQVMELLPLEPALPFASFLRRQGAVNFRPDVIPNEVWGKDVRPISDPLLRRGANGFRLTDSEWEHLKGRHGLGRVKRATVDALLLKMGDGVSWRSFGGNAGHVHDLYARLKKTIGWAEFRRRVNRLRPFEK